MLSRQQVVIPVAVTVVNSGHGLVKLRPVLASVYAHITLSRPATSQQSIAQHSKNRTANTHKYDIAKEENREKDICATT